MTIVLLLYSLHAHLNAKIISKTLRCVVQYTYSVSLVDVLNAMEGLRSFYANVLRL